MSTQNSLDKVFQIIMRRFIETGQAPHYTEIADQMDLPVEEGRNRRGFKPGNEEGVNKMSAIAGLFSGRMFTKRLKPDYASYMQEYLGEFVKALSDIGLFWQLAQK